MKAKEKELFDTLMQVSYEFVTELPSNPNTNTIYFKDRGNYIRCEDGEIVRIFEEYIWQDQWILVDRIEHKKEEEE